MKDTERHAMHGREAMRVGTPDFAQNDIRTNATDTIANVLHALADEQLEQHAGAILGTALSHFEAERAE